MGRRSSFARSLAPLVLGLVLGLCFWVVWPAQAFAAALVRFIHAVPGAGTATVDVDSGSGEQNFGSIGFSQVTPFQSLRSGSFQWRLKSAGTVLAAGTSTVGDGVYDLVVLDKPSGTGVELGVYRDAGARAGTSLVRVIHAVPELGSPMIMLDRGTLASRLPYLHATRYFSITPGTHSLSAMKPWLMKPGDPTLVDAKALRFTPGVAYSAIVVGSRGQRVRVVRVVDRGAPLTRPASLGTMAHPAAKRHSSRAGSAWVMVRPGDSLWAIARHLVGSAATNEQVERKVVALWNLNAQRIGTGDPNLVFPGQHLMLPASSDPHP